MHLKLLRIAGMAAAVAVSASLATQANAGGVPPLPVIEPVTVTEVVSPFDIFTESFRIDYTIANPNSDLSIIGFAVDFGIPDDAELFSIVASAERSDWNGAILNETDWNAGTKDGASSPIGFSSVFTDDLGTFDNFFGTSAEQAAFFFLGLPGDVPTGSPIGPDDGTVAGFAVVGKVVGRSQFVAICGSVSGSQPGQVCATGPVTAPVSSVAEPGTLALVGVGMIGLGITVRRRRRTV